MIRQLLHLLTMCLLIFCGNETGSSSSECQNSIKAFCEKRMECGIYSTLEECRQRIRESDEDPRHDSCSEENIMWYKCLAKSDGCSATSDTIEACLAGKIGSTVTGTAQESTLGDSAAVDASQPVKTDIAPENATILTPEYVQSVTASSVLQPDKAPGRYSAEKITDGDPDTAWGSARGRYRGEWLQINFVHQALVTKVEIKTGYTSHFKKRDLFPLNRRIKSAEVSVGTLWKKTHQFDDNPAWQLVKIDPPEKVQKVRIKILDIFEGSRWEDLHVSEVRVWGVMGDDVRTKNKSRKILLNDPVEMVTSALKVSDIEAWDTTGERNGAWIISSVFGGEISDCDVSATFCLYPFLDGGNVILKRRALGHEKFPLTANACREFEDYVYALSKERWGVREWLSASYGIRKAAQNESDAEAVKSFTKIMNKVCGKHLKRIQASVERQETGI